MSEDSYGKYRIVHGDVRLEDPTYGQSERDAYIAEVIELASIELSKQGCEELTPLKVVPARTDDDYFHFLHIGSSMIGGEHDGAFHFALQREEPNMAPDEAAAHLAQAAKHYLERRNEIIGKASKIFDEIAQHEWPEGFDIHEVAALMDIGGTPQFSAEMTMLEFDLIESNTRRTGHTASVLIEELEGAAKLHRQRMAALAERIDARCDLFVEDTAQHLLEHYDLTVEKVLDVLAGTHWMDIYDERDDAKYSVATLHLQNGTLVADMRASNYAWELRGSTFVLANAVSLPETVRVGLTGQPLSKLLRTGNMLDDLIIESLDSRNGETQYIELNVPRTPIDLHKRNHLPRAA